MTDIFDLIRADRPRDEYREQVMLFGRLVGSWKVASTWTLPDGNKRKAAGEWHFQWILGGMGVQDVLYADSYGREKYGTTIRCYDPEKDLWHISWMQPGNGEFAVLTAREVNGTIEQEVLGLSDRRQIWRFSAVTPHSFVWRDEVSDDSGRSWRVDQEMVCTRD